MTRQNFLSYLHQNDFRQLFVECGWNNPNSRRPHVVKYKDCSYSVREVAHQKGFGVFVCEVEAMPDYSTRKFLDSQIIKFSHCYFVIYVLTSEPFHHLWSIPVRGVDRRQLVTIEYVQDDQATFLLEKLNAITFSLSEDPTLVDVEARVNAAFLINTAEITKKFYQSFRKQHDKFVESIMNLEGADDREWYASVMLNRLMFCYFIQKKGFFGGNENYLAEKLAQVQSERGKNKFFNSFYRGFLKQLFSDGLDRPVGERSAEFAAKYGKIPYLNGGMFAQHLIELNHPEIDIPDQVFASLFEFFDQWGWNLDLRMTATGRDINPDVLGYIFEQYINDRAKMGAYYTKEDITEYIGRNCIVTYLLNAVKKLDPKPFGKSGEVWQTLKTSGDRYIFDAVRKGVDLPLPTEIEKGVDPAAPDLPARRAGWNKPADEAYALPTEIWRETVARRQRYAEIHAKIASGAITDVHDFITYNLDIRRFAEDLIRNTADHRFVLHFYKTLREVTILDPTCGSGAFLFAALNILEPLYKACLNRMTEFHERNPKLFAGELAEIEGKFRSNQEYFICKNIILRNLYGVDIMHEATEIARLRLFLKIVATVNADQKAENLGLDPLPDIDFNVRCGNTLVGYATEQEIKDGIANGDMFAWAELKAKIDDALTKAAMSFDYFRKEQLNLQGDHQALIEAKNEVSGCLAAVANLLDDYLYDRKCGKTKAQWKADTQPFHWYTEFYPIMHDRGGFDVIIGNPPYVECSKIEKDYKVNNYDTFSCGNLYALVFERSTKITTNISKIGMIVQLPIVCTDRMKKAQDILSSKRTWIATFDDRPGKLFDDLTHIRSTIFITDTSTKEEPVNYTTKYNRWYSENRDIVFQLIDFAISRKMSGTIPKLGNETFKNILDKLLLNNPLGNSFCNFGKFVYYHNAPQYFIRGTTFIPYFWNEKDGIKSSVSIKTAQFNDDMVLIASCILCSSIFYLWFIATSDCRHLNDREVRRFPFDKEIDVSLKQNLIKLGQDLMDDLEKNKYRKEAFYKTTGKVVYDEYYPKLSKPIIDEIDTLLAKHYGFTAEELDFIINYDIKYRMGDELNGEE